MPLFRVAAMFGERNAKYTYGQLLFRGLFVNYHFIVRFVGAPSYYCNTVSTFTLYCVSMYCFVKLK